MKCYCCDKILSNYEATLRRRGTDEFTDMCLKCLKGLSIATQGNPHLLLEKQMPDAEDYNEDPTLNLDLYNSLDEEGDEV